MNGLSHRMGGRRISRVLLRLAAILGFAVVAVVVARNGGPTGIAGGSLLVVLTAGMTAVRLTNDPLDAVGLYGLLSALMFGLLSLLWLGSPPVAAPGVSSDGIARALLLVGAGLAAFACGSWLTAGRPSGGGASPSSIQRPPSRPVFLAVFSASAIGGLVGIALGAIGYDSELRSSSWLLSAAQVFTQVSLLGMLVVLATALAFFRSSSSSHLRRLLILFVLAQVALGFASGFKGLSLAPVLLVLLAYISTSGRVPWRTIGLITAAVAFLLLPANLLYRDIVRPPTVGSDRAGNVADRAETYALVRYRLIDHVALIQTKTPDVYPYAGGLKYFYLPQIAFVPRVVWQDKPILDDGLDFSHTYWEIPLTTETSTPLTQIGDLYRNFGYWGVIVGMLIWGLVVGALTRLRNTDSIRVEMVYLFMLLVFVSNIESDLPQLISFAAKTLPVAAATAWLLLPNRDGEPGYRVLNRLHRATSRSPQRA